MSERRRIKEFSHSNESKAHTRNILIDTNVTRLPTVTNTIEEVTTTKTINNYLFLGLVGVILLLIYFKK